MLIRYIAWKLLIKTFGAQHAIRKIEFNLAKKWLSPKNKDRICDVACGRGELSFLLSNNGASVTGVDVSDQNMFFILNCPEKTKFVTSNAEKTPFPNSSFDKVACNASLQLFPDDKKVLREMSRIIKKGGLLFLTVDSFSSPKISKCMKKLHKMQDKVYNYYDIPKLKKLLGGAGFQIIHNEYYIKGRFSSYLFELGIKSRWSKWWDIFSIIAYPLCRISESFSESKHGYGLAVLAKAG